MDSEVRSRIVVEAKDQASEDVRALTSALRDNTEALKSEAEAEKKSTETAKEHKVSIADVAAVYYLATKAIGQVKAVYDDVIGSTVRLAEEQRNLARAGGISVEEAGKIIQVSDDLQVSTTTLETAFRKMNTEGIQPTFENIKRMAVEYQALENPVDRAQYALDHFGRSGAEMQKILEKDTGALDEMAESAMKANIVMGEKGVKAARDYEIAVDNLSDSFLGLKVSIAEEALPEVTKFLNEANSRLELFGALRRAIDAGAMSWVDYTRVGFQVQMGMTTTEKALAEVDDALGVVIARKEAWISTLTSWRDESIKTAAITDAWGNELDGLGNSAEKAAEKVEEMKQGLLNAGLSGTIGKATEDYAETWDDLQTKIADTRTELEKYQGLQGQSVTVTTEATTSQLQYNNAVFDAETANIRLAEAQQRLSENTDPEKARDLEGALLDAALAAERAQGNIGKLGEGLGGSETITLNYTGKIGELTGVLGELEAKASAAREQMHQLTNEFIFQQISSQLNADAALDLARNMGLIDEQSYSLSKVVQETTEKFDRNKDGMIDATEEANGYGTAIMNIANAAASLQDRHVTITVDIIRREMTEQATYDDLLNAGQTPEGAGWDGSILGGSGAGSSGASGVPRARGGAIRAGGAYIMNEDASTRPEIVVANQGGGGYVLTKQDAQEALAAQQGWGQGTVVNLTINQTIANPVDAEMNARRTAQLIEQNKG